MASFYQYAKSRSGSTNIDIADDVEGYLNTFLVTKSVDSMKRFVEGIDAPNYEFAEKIIADTKNVLTAYFDTLIDRAIDAFNDRNRNGNFVPFSNYTKEQLIHLDRRTKASQDSVVSTSKYLETAANNDYTSINIDEKDMRSAEVKNLYGSRDPNSLEKDRYVNGYQSANYATTSMFCTSTVDPESETICLDDYSKTSDSRRRRGRDDEISLTNTYSSYANSIMSTLSDVAGQYAGSAYKSVQEWFNTGSDPVDLMECLISKKRSSQIMNSNGVEKLDYIRSLVKNYLAFNQDTLAIICDSVRDNKKLNSVLKADTEESYKNVFMVDSKLWELCKTILTPTFCAVLESFSMTQNKLLVLKFCVIS